MTYSGTVHMLLLDLATSGKAIFRSARTAGGEPCRVKWSCVTPLIISPNQSCHLRGQTSRRSHHKLYFSLLIFLPWRFASASCRVRLPRTYICLQTTRYFSCVLTRRCGTISRCCSKNTSGSIEKNHLTVFFFSWLAD